MPRAGRPRVRQYSWEFKLEAVTLSQLHLDSDGALEVGIGRAVDLPLIPRRPAARGFHRGRGERRARWAWKIGLDYMPAREAVGFTGAISILERAVTFLSASIRVF